MSSAPGLVARLRAAGCVFAEEEAALLCAATDSPEELETLVGRRVGGEPLETVLGWALFAGLRIACAPGVFVPRRRTELMVALAIERLGGGSGIPGDMSGTPDRSGGEARRAGWLMGRHRRRRPGADVPRGSRGAERCVPASGRVVLDLGCGTGAIAAAVAAGVPEVEAWAVDVDPAAVDCARRNLPAERVLLGDLYGPLPPRLRFDAILANAPYVPTEEIALMPPEARDHEHRVALDGGDDGLDVQRRAIAGAPGRLAPNGAILVETGRRQAEATTALMRGAGLRAVVETDDEIDGTVVVGTR